MENLWTCGSQQILETPESESDTREATLKAKAGQGNGA